MFPRSPFSNPEISFEVNPPNCIEGGPAIRFAASLTKLEARGHLPAEY